MPRPTLHLVPEAAWVGRDASVPYVPTAYAADGFIHCTDGDEEMLKTANRFYRSDPQAFLVVTIDLELAGSPWRIDDPGTPWPHVYGPIDPGAVTDVRRFVRDTEGTFLAIGPR